MCASRSREKGEEPCWPSLPLTGWLVAEQKRRCLSLTLFNTNHRSFAVREGGDGGQCLRNGPQDYFMAAMFSSRITQRSICRNDCCSVFVTVKVI